jgi:hypothetical protein
VACSFTLRVNYETFRNNPLYYVFKGVLPGTHPVDEEAPGAKQFDKHLSIKEARR